MLGKLFSFWGSYNTIGEKSRGKKDPDTMEIDKIQRKKGKNS